MRPQNKTLHGKKLIRHVCHGSHLASIFERPSGEDWILDWVSKPGGVCSFGEGETGLMLKGLNSGRCDWMAACRLPHHRFKTQDYCVLRRGTCLHPPSADPTQPPGAARGRGCCPVSWQPSSPGPGFKVVCSRRPKTSPHRENSPARVTRLGSPLSPTAVSRRERLEGCLFPANCPKQREPRQKWVMEKGTRQKTWSWKRQPDPGTHSADQPLAPASYGRTPPPHTWPSCVSRIKVHSTAMARCSSPTARSVADDIPSDASNIENCSGIARPAPDNEGHAPDSGRKSQNGNQNGQETSAASNATLATGPATLYATLASIRPSARERGLTIRISTPARLLGIACG